MTSLQMATTAVLATAAVAGGAAYAALWPQSQLFGRVLVAGSNPNEIALTYDDGPNDDATERLLEVLARHQVHATFFLIGGFVRQRRALVRSIAAAGHLIGNHTMTHPWLSWQTSSRIRQELAQHGVAADGATLQQLRDTELERAREVWRRKFARPAVDPIERARQMRFLARRGFSADVVRRVIQGGDDD